jgi:hypothetical protein
MQQMTKMVVWLSIWQALRDCFNSINNIHKACTLGLVHVLQDCHRAMLGVSTDPDTALVLLTFSVYTLLPSSSSKYIRYILTRYVLV